MLPLYFTGLPGTASITKEGEEATARCTVAGAVDFRYTV